jgi:hypothetical protein
LEGKLSKVCPKYGVPATTERARDWLRAYKRRVEELKGDAEFSWCSKSLISAAALGHARNPQAWLRTQKNTCTPSEEMAMESGEANDDAGEIE